MKRVLERLDVYIHGDRLHTMKPVDIVYRERMSRDIKSKVEIPDHARKTFGTFRNIRKTVEVSPNAPLLKRLNKNPQTLEKAYFRKEKLLRFQLQERKRVVFPKIIEELLQIDRKVRKIQPMQFHIRPATITIPSIEEWLNRSSMPSQQSAQFQKRDTK